MASGSSSFGQFRLTQFVDNAPPNATPDSQHTSSAASSADAERRQMAHSSRSSTGQNIDRTQSAAPAGPVQKDEIQPNPSTAGFGTLELAANPIIEGILGSNKDGRVRNPTPAKLKGKTDNKLGNFGVMQMGVSPPGKKNDPPGKDAAAERDAAARRTSENTASRAKASQQEKYISRNRKGLEAKHDAQRSRGSSFVPAKEDHKQRGRPLAPDETKIEQARLLTLLRSIHPLAVVDQICKAVAYFGGIPGAPPPENGIFPESANTGETGALFIGWLAEIFPDLSSPEVPRIQEPPGGNKYKSRVSKVTPASESPNPRNGFGYGQAVSAPSWGLPQPLSLVNTIGTIPNSEPEQASDAKLTDATPEQKSSEQGRPLTPVKQQLQDAPPRTTSTSKRGRGRPKGSRNKGKNDTRPSDTTNTVKNGVDGHKQVTTKEHETPDVPVHIQATLEQAIPSRSSAYVSQAADQTTVKPAQILQSPERPWQMTSGKNQVNPPASVAPIDELSAEERAVLEAFRLPQTQQINSTNPITASTKQSPAGGVKRKRAPPKPKANVTLPSNPSAEASKTAQAVKNIHTPDEAGSGGLKGAVQRAPIGTPTPTILPAAKRQRQRKPKASTLDDLPSQNRTPSVLSTPPTAPSTIPDSTASSQQSMPVSRPPVEGLEAHYERFASLPQQNGRSNTPSITPQQLTPQQQLRQQQKPAVPPASQQPVAQQHQTHMQQQKSQQGVQREDQKMGQGSSARSSSTGYYNQRNQGTTFSQQYPSHQPSQLYGSHQASPQMSTNSSYRANSTHTLAQAASQFSQTDSTYKSASPRTIPQSSPSFTQSDSTFRTPSTHSLAQPSPTYSQPESTYRTASIHSLSQPSPAYSRPNTQSQASHQSHYNHFSENAYVDLPTLESLGHSGTSTDTGVTISSGPYGQSLGVSVANAPSSRPGSNSVYGTTSAISNTFDTSANDLLRGVSRSASGSNAALYGTSSGLSHAFEPNSEQEMRERLMKNIGGFNRR